MDNWLKKSAGSIGCEIYLRSAVFYIIIIQTYVLDMEGVHADWNMTAHRCRGRILFLMAIMHALWACAQLISTTKYREFFTDTGE